MIKSDLCENDSLLENETSICKEGLNNETKNVSIIDPQQPNQRSRLILYFFIYLIGVSILLPYNIFISAYQYFVQHKLKFVDQKDGTTNVYQDYYISYVGISVQALALVTAALNNFTSLFNRFTLLQRIKISYIAAILFCLISIILAIVDTSNYVFCYFIMTIFMAFLINGFQSILQCCTFGYIATLDKTYLNCVNIGMNTSGVVTTLLVMLTSAVFEKNLSYAGILLFSIALLITLIAFAASQSIPNTMAYKYEINKTKVIKVSQKIDNEENVSLHHPYFKALVVFLNFNLFALLGSLLASVYCSQNDNFYLITTISRILFLPLALLFNLSPKETRFIPRLIKSDLMFGIFVSLLAISNGYILSGAVMMIPENLPNKIKGSSAMLAGLVILSAIFLGLCLAFPLNYLSLLENSNSANLII
ncbi:hypothetical protein A3Q56_00279 [Intoshia linei]|uniref:Equilibrative nucleoside transporter 3 n=1 Tax=Intoshia linei TaxID=1819745 RepID=A0A177BCB7_9BILA|nr:hypothetical protein A3Q56_00279 [Intoshia linei]